MEVRGIKSFTSTRYGFIDPGRTFDCDPGIAKQWAEAGMVEILDEGYDTKVVDDAPKPAPRTRKRATKD